MIGDTLRKERERQKLSIQDVEQGTSIRSIYIEALEKGDYDSLPGKVYAKGFVKNYANFLGLDADKLSKDFSAEISPPVIEVGDNIPTEVITVEPQKQSKLKITELKEPDLKVKHRGESSNSSLFIIAAVVLIALFAGGAWYYLDSQAVANVNPPQPEVNQPVEPAPVENPVSAAIPQDGVNVHAVFTMDCWTRVMIDGVVIYEGMIPAGDVYDWHGIEGVTLRVGNAGAVDITSNGQYFGTLGGVGEVLERTFLTTP